MHRPHAPTQRKCVPIISHNNHQSDITICKGCPTRKDASPSCTNLEESLCPSQVAITIEVTDLVRATKRCPAGKDASPSCTNLDGSVCPLYFFVFLGYRVSVHPPFTQRRQQAGSPMPSLPSTPFCLVSHTFFFFLFWVITHCCQRRLCSSKLFFLGYHTLLASFWKACMTSLCLAPSQTSC